jgi:hypothetical protein
MTLGCNARFQSVDAARDRKACLAMERPKGDEETTRNQLKTERNLLFEEFSRNPSKTRLAIEIRLIDDRIADLTRRLGAKKKCEPDFK